MWINVDIWCISIYINCKNNMILNIVVKVIDIGFKYFWLGGFFEIVYGSFMESVWLKFVLIFVKM